MKSTVAYSLILLLAVVSFRCNRLPGPFNPEPPAPAFQRGMNMACWQQNCFDGEKARQSLQRLQTTGARWVAIVVTVYQNRANDDVLQYPQSVTPGDASLIRAIEQARGLGFKMMLKPHVDVWDGTWRGKINPRHPQTWLANYTDYILHYAELAEAYNIEQFVIGTELVMLSKRTDFWVNLIKSIRGVYSGKLLYAASWNEYEAIGFWPALDFVGINAFFPLTNMKDPGMIDLLAGWEYWINKLTAWQSHIDKPMIFTEIGYTSRDGTNMHPFKFDSYEKIDLQEQADCYAAALQIFPKLTGLSGAYWWYWRTDMSGGVQNGDYSPFDKPAEQILRQAWNGAHP